MLFSLAYSKHLLVISTVLLVLTACQPDSAQPVKRQLQAAGGAYAADISEDGHYSVVSSTVRGIDLWDIANNKIIYNWSQQQDSANNLVLSVDIAANNSHVLTANRTAFALWNMQNGHAEGYWKVRESTIRDIAVANNGNYLLIGKSNGVVVHVTMATGRRLEFLGHQEKINSIDMLPNGRIAISGGNDYVAYVWDTKSGQIIYRFNHPTRVSKVALDPKGRFAFTADSRKNANLWDLKTGKLISKLKYTQRQEIFSAVRFSADGKTMLTGSPTRKVSLWNIATGERIRQWFVPPKDNNRPSGAVVYSVAFSDIMSDKPTVLTLSSSGYLETWPTP
jgi:WD40 repeat protein